MKVFITEESLKNRIDFCLNQLESDIHDLMMNHVNKNEIVEADLLSIIYSKIGQMGELMEIYKESLDRNE